MKSLVKRLIAPFVLATALLFSPLKLNANNHSIEKINSPANAEQVIQMGKYQRWKINNVWYSDVPLEILHESNSKALSKKTGYEDIRMNSFVQPNDTTLAYYGSGDSDGNNILNQDDLNLMSVKSGQVDQTDVDGNGISFETSDYTFLFEHINNNSILPSDWNQTWKLNIPKNRESWLEKMLTIDKTDTISYTDNFMCGNFSDQTIFNFYGFGEINKDSSLIEENNLTKYDFSNNGRFNIPMFFTTIVSYQTGNAFSHAIVCVLKGEDPLNFNNWNFIEPQDDSKVKPGDFSIPNDSQIQIYYSHFLKEKSTGRTHFIQEPFLEFKLNNSIPELIKYDDRLILNPNVKIESDLEKNARNFKLNQNYPNPANPNTTIKYSIPLEDKVKLQVYDITGKLVKTLVNEKQRAGEYKVDLNASGFSSGIYLYRIETSAGIQTNKLTILK